MVIRDRFQTQLEELVRQVDDLGRAVVETIRDSVDALEALDVETAKALIEGDSAIDSARHRIDEGAYLVLATQQPAAIDLRTVMGCIQVAGELERIADHSSGIARLTLTMAGEPKNQVPPQIKQMSTVASGLLDKAVAAFVEHDARAAGAIWKRDDEIDDLYREFFQFQIDDMVEHRKRVRSGTYLLWVAHNIERMADRVTNIAEATAFVVTADVAAWRSELEAEVMPSGR